MNEATSPVQEPKRPKGSLVRVREAWQWAVVLLFAIVVLALLSDQSKLAAPGAPVALFWTAIGIGGVIILAHAPPLFMRLPPKGRSAVYLASVAYVVLVGFTFSQVAAAWEKTPQGAVEAKQLEAENDARIEENVRRQSQEADLQAAQQRQKQVTDSRNKLESCFTTFGHRLPALEGPFKEALHNPDAFEHVETVAINPDADGYNVAMKFRAENGFGAIRLGIVRAAVDPSTCDVVSTGNSESM